MARNISVIMKAVGNDFKRAVSEINSEMKLMRAEINNSQLALGNSASEYDKAKVKLEGYKQQLEYAKKKLELLTEAYNESKRKTSENSSESRRLAQSLEHAKKDYYSLKNAIDATSSSMNTQAGASSALGGVLKNAFSTALGIGFFQAVKSGFSNTISSGFAFNSMLEQTNITFKTLLGNQEEADKLLNWMKKFAARTPFEFNDLAQGTKMLMAFGFNAKEIPNMMKKIGDASAALGLSGAEGFERIGAKLGQMKQTQQVTTRELKSLAMAGLPVWDILSKAIGKTTAETMDLVSKGLLPADDTIQALLNGMGERYDGLMEKQSGTWAGLTSTLKDNFAELTSILTSGLFESIGQIISFVIERIQAFNDIAQEQGIRAALETMIPVIVLDLLDILISCFTWIIENWGLVKVGLIAIGAGFATIKLASLIKNLGGVTGMFKKLKGVIDIFKSKLVIAGLVVGVFAGLAYLMYKTWSPTAAFFTSLWELIVAAFNMGLAGIDMGICAVRASVVSMVAWISNKVLSVISDLMYAASYIPVIGDRFYKAYEGIEGKKKSISEWEKGEWQKVSNSANKAGQSVKALGTAWNGVKQAGVDMVSAMKDEVKGFGNIFGGIGKDVDSNIKETAPAMEKSGIKLGKNVKNGAAKGAKGTGKGVAKEVKEGISESVSETIKELDNRIAAATKSNKTLEEQESGIRIAMQLTTDKIKILNTEFNRLKNVKNANQDALKKLQEDIVKTKEKYADLADKLIDTMNKINEANAKSINAYAEDIKKALKARYDAEKKMREEALNHEIKANDEWKEKTVKSIESAYDYRIKRIRETKNAQIDALNEELRLLDKQKEDSDRANKDAEDIRKINNLKRAIEFEHDEYNRKQLEKELIEAQNNFKKRKEEEILSDRKDKIKDKIELLKTELKNEEDGLNESKKREIEQINFMHKIQKESLKLQQDRIKKFYEQKTKDAQLQAEAEIMILKNQQEEINTLLIEFGENYKRAGQTFGEKMVTAFKPYIEQIKTMIADTLSQIDLARTKAINAQVEASKQREGKTINNNISTTINNAKLMSIPRVRSEMNRTGRDLAFQLNAK